MKKIKLKVCCGTYCHIMGGAELQLLNELIEPELFKQVELSFSTCLGYCKNEGVRAPYVEIDGKAMAEASIEKIKSRLIEIIEK